MEGITYNINILICKFMNPPINVCMTMQLFVVTCLTISLVCFLSKNYMESLAKSNWLKLVKDIFFILK